MNSNFLPTAVFDPHGLPRLGMLREDPPRTSSVVDDRRGQELLTVGSLPGFSEAENQLLQALSPGDSEHLAPHLEPVRMVAGQVLKEPLEPLEYAYFPVTAVLSLVALMGDGRESEVAVVGREGMIGVRFLLGTESTLCQCRVQVGGEALRIRARLLKAEYERSAELQGTLCRYVQARLVLTSQMAACSSLHSLEKRFLRTLLMIQDRVQSECLLLTHDAVARLLGVRRAGITVAASRMQEEGLIRNGRGKIIILDREGIAARVCECYELIHSEFARLLGPVSSFADSTQVAGA